ncbi:BadF/BadG/BcrA/BcrD ATPase family protein, partial [Photobacterium sanctipauli]
TTLYGGWGFPIGDEGGGAWIGFNAVQYLIESLESKRESTTHKNDQQALLTKTLTPIVGGRRDQLLTWLKSASASNYAQLAPVVINCAEQGCRSSQGILARGTKHIEQLAIKCCKNNNLDIVFLGGLSHYYQHQLPEHWQQRIIKPKGNALDGATLLARKFAGDIDE